MNFSPVSNRRAVVAEEQPLTVVLWVFRDYEDRWCVRIEGEDGVREYPVRADAAAAARRYGTAWGSYRIFLQLKDGRVTQELFNPEPVLSIDARQGSGPDQSIL